ncbi:MAG: RNA polymerase factor sigma-54 [Pseudomonadales bacterium]|nr:RNA polymerase factor sigma-54 [Pseudomonadales bacterium]MBO6594228.1 RNA polymerase factor sigma-54 [Pseudomonadales bacterium]MBO6656309.1 RNA polymerase factor sigma-54 [Pseudomonadales bacterium]MBO6700727.1 RNA polymerase factor sigma-54 [Pseudomonadales bacterium]MBO6822211.1 RNA polymerase factor sigma-54 [Pseudomonadales bacterium]
MTPQLQQAIRLLQLSSVDLEMEIQEALDSNFMLEEVDPDGDSNQEATSLDEPEAATEDTSNSTTETSGNDSASDDQPKLDPEVDGEHVKDSRDEVDGESIAVDLPVDTSWEDVYDDNFVSSSGGGDYSDENFLETRNADSASIQSHLLDQLNLLNLTESDQYIAACILDGLDEEGVLQIDVEDILESAPDEWEIEIEEVDAVLHLIQHLDPVGIAARSLKECLAIQLKELPEDTEGKTLALTLVENHISLLANRDYVQLARKLKVKEPELKHVITLIQTLNPRPGASIVQENVDYIEPDVFVSKQNGRWVVELNPKSAPKIRVNPEYAALIKRGDSSDDAINMKNHMQEARWFIKSLQQRNDTLLRVSSKIVEFQRGFLEYGEQAMKPLVLHDIAEAVDLHESTISRVTTQKYMLTPAGVFELKYFFSSHVSTSSGGEVSSTAIRALIKQLVAEENPRKPLSDSKIAKLLEEQNINVARRTIAKYRELLLIPPSNERKQLI